MLIPIDMDNEAEKMLKTLASLTHSPQQTIFFYLEISCIYLIMIIINDLKYHVTLFHSFFHYLTI